MGNMIRNVFRVATALLAGSLLWISSAGALPMQLIVSNSITGVCFDSGLVAGPLVNFTGACGPIFTFNGVTGTSTSLPSLDLGSSNITSSGVGDLTMTLFAFGLTSPVGFTSWFATFVGSWTEAHAGTLVTSQDFVNGIQVALLSSSITPFNLATTTNIAGLTGPYNLEMIITIHSTGTNLFSLDEQLVGRAPEPASMALLGAGLLALGLIRRRKQS